ncbi:MAG: hypothetical protein J5589_02400 [Firmicutes bacterium]|nr:hypothetical protein [Bacillota bacterium]
MPDPVRDELLKTLGETEINTPEFTKLKNDLAALNAEMDSLMQVDENGWKMLNQERYISLMRKYTAVGTSMEQFLEAAEGSEDPAVQAGRELTLKVSAILSQDMNTLRRYNPTDEAGQKSLEAVLNESRIPVLDPGQEKTTRVGGQLSSRIPLSFIDSNGRRVSGVFTMPKYFDPESELKSAQQTAGAGAKTPEGKQLLEGLYEKYKEYYRNRPDKDHQITGNEVNNIMRFYKDLCEPGSDAVSGPRVLRMMARLNHRSEAYILDKCGSKAIKTMTKETTKLYNNGLFVNGSAGIPAKARIDKRNAAMSSVADLLGMPNIIARSRTMKIRTKDGQDVEGVFMEEAKGFDANHPPASALTINSKSMQGTNGRAFRQLADIQALDYICGNVDRHGGNMLYTFDKKDKLIGIQGIDNDCSFGTVETLEKPVNRMVAPVDMLVISKRTANRILATTPEMLRFALRGQVEEKAIKGAENRLMVMQAMIQSSRKKLDPNRKDIQRPYIRELDDKDFASLKMTDLTHPGGTSVLNTFAIANATVSKMHLTASTQNRGLRTTQIGTTDRGTMAGLQNEARRTALMSKKLSDRTSLNFTSGRYQDIQKALKDYSDFQKQLTDRMTACRERVKKGDMSPDAVYGQYVTQWDLDQMQAKLKKVKSTGEEYLNKKNEDLNGADPSRYTKKRMDAVQDVLDFADNALKFSEEERKTVQENQRVATEQFVKHEVKKQAQAPKAPEDPQMKNKQGEGMDGPKV